MKKNKKMYFQRLVFTYVRFLLPESRFQVVSAHGMTVSYCWIHLRRHYHFLRVFCVPFVKPTCSIMERMFHREFWCVPIWFVWNWLQTTPRFLPLHIPTNIDFPVLSYSKKTSLECIRDHVSWGIWIFSQEFCWWNYLFWDIRCFRYSIFWNILQIDCTFGQPQYDIIIWIHLPVNNLPHLLHLWYPIQNMFSSTILQNHYVCFEIPHWKYWWNEKNYHWIFRIPEVRCQILIKSDHYPFLFICHFLNVLPVTFLEIFSRLPSFMPIFW